MPDFLHSIQGQDIGYLRIVAEQWSVELKSNTFHRIAQELAASILNPQLISEMIATLRPEAATALTALVASGGRLPWTAFVREFGEVREMGTGKRDRERPYLKPDSAAEALFYRVLIARAFFDTEKGPQEFAYIPDDLLNLLRKTLTTAGRELKLHNLAISTAGSGPLGRLAVPAEHAHILVSSDSILDDATTLLAALRAGHAVHADPFLQDLLHAAGLLKKNVPHAERVKTFLELPRAQALDILIQSWRKSETLDELRLIPGLICEGEWSHFPFNTRKTLLDLFASIPRNSWWSLNALVNDIRQKQPDFQRPAGDYDSWFIKRQSDGAYLRGFASWDEVDGALIRFFITNITFRLGMLDLAEAQAGMDFTAFRFHSPGTIISRAEIGKLKISSNGKLSVQKLAPRAVRYQIARFSQPEDETPEEYHYRITPASLTIAKVQGLNIEQILGLLSRHSPTGIPPVLVKALKHWKTEGTMARAETQVILRVKKPEILTQLRESRVARFLGQALGPTAVVIKPGAQSKVLAAIAELGFLAEDATSETSNHIVSKP